MDPELFFRDFQFFYELFTFVRFSYGDFKIRKSNT